MRIFTKNMIRGVLEVIPLVLVLVAWVSEAVKAEQVEPTAEKATLSTLEQLNRYSAEGRNTTEQVTSVSQLTDVRPTDWAYQALKSLVERYGCIVGYPDKTYRGNRALSRWEFAAGLNACLDKIQELIAAATADFVSKEDLETVKKLQEAFAAELSALRGRVDALEVRTATLEKQQFSTTTKLTGEALFTIADTFGDAVQSDDPTEAIFAYRARLNFNTSFTGKDQLRIRLQGRNVPEFNRAITGTNMTRLSFDGDSGGSVGIDDLFYRFPIGSKTTAWLIANGYGTENLAPSLNPLESDAQGAVSRFARFSPIYRIVEGSGFGLAHKFTDAIELAVAYRARNANNPAEKNGLFNGNYGAFSQLTFNLSQDFRVGLHYANVYFPGSNVNVSGGTGSLFAQRPFGNVATLTNTYGAVASYRFSPKFILSGWVGYTDAEARSGINRGRDASIWNWLVSLAFPDLGSKGALAGISVGMPPRAAENDIRTRRDRDVSIHLEGFYRYRVTDNISITPGLFVIFNPEHNSANNTQFVGLIRTTFSF
jgi:hypothetical protein